MELFKIRVIMSRFIAVFWKSRMRIGVTALLLASRSGAAVEPPPTVTPHEMAAFPAKEVILKFYVRQTGYNGNGDYVELYTQIAWDHPDNVFVRVAPSVQARLGALGIFDTAGHFSGRTLRVRGVVEQVEFGAVVRPCLYVTSLDQMEVVRAPEHAQEIGTYETVPVGDFVLKISPAITGGHPKERGQLIDLMTRQAAQIQAALPAATYTKLKGATVWAHWDTIKLGMAYHPDAGFLRKAGIPAELHRGVEIQNLRNYLDWTTGPQPWALLHEFAHKYHHEVLGPNHEEVRKCYESAMARGLYRSVSHVSGKKEVAYATADRFEYFAELTEAYFGKNDFFPFTREELRRHDPRGFALMEACWETGQ